MQCLVPKSAKMCIFVRYFCMILHCFFCETFYVLFRIIYHLFCFIFSSKSCFFRVFREKKIIIMISPSETGSTRLISDNSGLTMHSGHLVVLVMVLRILFVDSRAVNGLILSFIITEVTLWVISTSYRPPVYWPKANC